jgi:hypothetical protein
MLPSPIKTAPIEIVKTKASRHGGQAAGEVLIERSLSLRQRVRTQEHLERDPGGCSTASAGRPFFRRQAVSSEKRS